MVMILYLSNLNDVNVWAFYIVKDIREKQQQLTVRNKII